MMIIPYLDVKNFVAWVLDTTQEELNIHDHFPLSKKIFAHENYNGPESGDLCSFTTIVPGAGVGKDPYWTITDAYKHLIEVSYICKYIHRHEDKEAQPELHFIFDGSSNHTARPFDALHVGAGICKGPGGANAPGAPLKAKKGNDKGKRTGINRLNMRNGWFINKKGIRVIQEMHRQKLWTDDTNSKQAIFNEVDGSIFKGVEQILKESLECDTLTACDGKPMPFRCNKTRRRKLNCTIDKSCTNGQQCCMHNTLRCRPDFCEQKCKLEEVCDSLGIKFHLLPICHPELNPIEGNTLAHLRPQFSSLHCIRMSHTP
jgi:hypothetical protein